MGSPMQHQALEFVVELSRKGREQAGKKGRSPPRSVVLVTGKA
jgi:hypothetical protein